MTHDVNKRAEWIGEDGQGYGEAEAAEGPAASVAFGQGAAARMRIEDTLAQQGVYVGTTVGVSMWPMLRDRRDTIIVEPLRGRRLRRFEVPLYRRGDAYVLHRCVEVRPGTYTMLGDNCLNKEREIPDACVIGVLTGFYRGDKRVDMEGLGYRVYVRIWHAIYPLRCVAMRARGLAGSARRKLLRTVAAQGEGASEGEGLRSKARDAAGAPAASASVPHEGGAR